jgi:DNA-binding MarR family transcriptional regulator
MVSEGKESNFAGVPDLDPVVHAPARLAILGILYVVEIADFVFLMRRTGLTRGNLSTHLSKLEAAGYISVEKKFVERMPRTLLRLTKQGRAALRKYRRQMSQALGELPE